MEKVLGLTFGDSAIRVLRQTSIALGHEKEKQ
jgi:hypothetical protein